MNCCNEPVDSRVCGLTANTLATVNTSPTVTVAEPVPPSILIVDWPSVEIVPFTKIVSIVERVPVVCCLIDCDILTSSKPNTPVPIKPFLNCLEIVSVGLKRPFMPSTKPALAAGLTVAYLGAITAAPSFSFCCACSKTNEVEGVVPGVPTEL